MGYSYTIMNKTTIPKSIKNSVWIEYVGKIFESKCYCCDNTTIDVFNFICGHVQSEYKGGEITLSNLRPICISCNSSMGTMDMRAFMKKYGYNYSKFSEPDIDSITNSSNDDSGKLMKTKLEKIYYILQLNFPTGDNIVECAINILKNNFITEDKFDIILSDYDKYKQLNKENLQLECHKYNLLNSGLYKNDLIRELICYNLGIYKSIVVNKEINHVGLNISLELFFGNRLNDLKEKLHFHASGENVGKIFEDNYYTIDKLNNVNSMYIKLNKNNKDKVAIECKLKSLFNDGLTKKDMIVEYLRHAI